MIVFSINDGYMEATMLGYDDGEISLDDFL
jgi:hypothetical protein